MTSRNNGPQYALNPRDQPTQGLPRWDLRLFDRWTLRRAGTEIALGSRAERLLSLFALRGGRSRSQVAGVLWPDSTEAHAAGNLRAAIWHVERGVPGLLQRDGSRLALAADVRIDVNVFLSWVRRIVGPDPTLTNQLDLARAVDILQSGDLLPGWYDDWALYERSRLSQLRLRSLEHLADRLLSLGDTTAAFAAALAAVAIEPLRESAHRALIRVHIADGNYHEAVREYRSFRAKLVAEMDVVPSCELESLIRPLLVRRIPSRRGEPRPAGSSRLDPSMPSVSTAAED